MTVTGAGIEMDMEVEVEVEVAVSRIVLECVVVAVSVVVVIVVDVDADTMVAVVVEIVSGGDSDVSESLGEAWVELGDDVGAEGVVGGGHGEDGGTEVRGQKSDQGS